MDASGREWIAVPYEGAWFVALTDDTCRSLNTHPIGFDTEREANRAASRLNERDGF